MQQQPQPGDFVTGLFDIATMDSNDHDHDDAVRIATDLCALRSTCYRLLRHTHTEDEPANCEQNAKRLFYMLLREKEKRRESLLRNSIDGLQYDMVRYICTPLDEILLRVTDPQPIRPVAESIFDQPHHHNLV